MKIKKKEGTKDSQKAFRLAQGEKSQIIVKLAKKAYHESRAKPCNSLEKLQKAVRQAINRASRQLCFSTIQKSTSRLATEPKKAQKRLAAYTSVCGSL